MMPKILLTMILGPSKKSNSSNSVLVNREPIYYVHAVAVDDTIDRDGFNSWAGTL